MKNYTQEIAVVLAGVLKNLQHTMCHIKLVLGTEGKMAGPNSNNQSIANSIFACINVSLKSYKHEIGFGRGTFVINLYRIAGPNFCKNPVSPPEEIFAVLIFALS